MAFSFFAHLTDDADAEQTIGRRAVKARDIKSPRRKGGRTQVERWGARLSNETLASLPRGLEL